MQMGMMYPDSVYCEFRVFPMDSLHHPVDSTFLCWWRVQIGSDSVDFTYMHCDSGYSNNNYMMGFQRSLLCRFRWDSMRVDAGHRSWRPTGVRCWDGTAWVTPSNVTVGGGIVTIVTGDLYAAIAVVGQPGGVEAVSGTSEHAASFELAQNYPNPFNPSTEIAYTVPGAGLVTLKIYDVLGREVATLVNEVKQPGVHQVRFDGSGLASGVYFYRLEIGTSVHTKSMVLLR